MIQYEADPWRLRMCTTVSRNLSIRVAMICHGVAGEMMMIGREREREREREKERDRKGDDVIRRGCLAGLAYPA